MLRGVKIYGNPILKKRSSPVRSIDSGIRRLAADMLETMYHYSGVGLAAPQVGELLRVITIDPRDPDFGPRVLVNPKITGATGEAFGEEGCLSLPNLYANVKRSMTISLTYTDLDGKEHNEQWSGFVARIAQHEIDHLNGVLFVERIDENQLEALREQLKSLKKERKELERIGPKIIEKSRGI
jgi:peptide deformylase